MITEIKRVLKPDGIFILMEEDFKESPTPIFTKMAPDLEKLVSLEKFIHYTKIKKMIEKEGFELIKETRTANDEFHDTVGMMYKLNIK